MRRIRLALLLVSAVTLGLVGILAWRANQGLVAERTMRHRAVAERTFEEMERALGDFLAREEARPFEHYAFYLPVGGERSPLATAPEPFVVGAFQVDPEGSLTTPLEPEDLALARARGDWPPAEPARLAASRVRSAVDALWPAPEAERREVQAGAGARDQARDAIRLAAKTAGANRDPAAPPPATQAPGTTRVESAPGFDAASAERDTASPSVAKEKEEEPNAFDVLESLNRVVDSRSERKQKVAQAPSSAFYGSRLDELAEASAPARELEAPATPNALADAAPAVGTLAAAPGAENAAPNEVTRVARPGPVRIAIDPMVGVASGAGELVLYRTVLVDHRGYRQGLVIDRAALGAWLDERVIRASGLTEVATVAFDGGPVRSDPGDRYVFVHRFAEPFDALQARLLLAPLPGVGSPDALYALVAVLLVMGAAGLLAVHRTVAVAVHYAERRSNFVAAVTHELKTPLTAIRMYAEMLRDGLVPSDLKRQEYYETITGESERLSRLVDNVLEFSKLESGRRDLATAVGSVGPVLEEAVEKLSPHAEREGFTLKVRLGPDLPVVRFDRDALLQVLFNLVDNAMKYARGAERRTVELEACREGDAVTVAVRDYGPGVARSHLERVFEPFYRGETELTRNAKGTGIGLALVKELAERMGAAVSGANADGGGFRVRLAFPVAGAA